MIIKELRSYDTPKIKSMVIKLKSSIMENRFKLSQGENVNTSDIRKSRRVIAQLMTILKERNEKITHSDWKGFGDMFTDKEEDKPNKKKKKAKDK